MTHPVSHIKTAGKCITDGFAKCFSPLHTNSIPLFQSNRIIQAAKIKKLTGYSHLNKPNGPLLSAVQLGFAPHCHTIGNPDIHTYQPFPKSEQPDACNPAQRVQADLHVLSFGSHIEGI
jgi:hypothetical protein